MSDTKISDAAVEAFDRAYYQAWRESTILSPGRTLSFHIREANRAGLTAALPHLHPQPAELAEQQGFELPPLPPSRGFIQWHSPQAIHQAHGFTASQMQDYARAALAATGKQQVGDTGCGACGDGCVDRPACRVAEESPPAQVGEVQGDVRAQFEAWNNSLPSLYRYNLNRWSNEAQEYRSRHTRAAFAAWQAALAARQPGAQEPVAWYVFADTEHWVTLDEDEADENRKEGCQVRPLVFGDIAAPPEQGIDLGHFRDAITREYANSRALCDMPRILECERLLALIDGQRDAAPGVGNSPTCNGSLQVATLSTAKPPHDLRTKVPAVAEIREDV